MSAAIGWADLLAGSTVSLSIPGTHVGSTFTETVAGTLDNVRERTKARPAQLTLARGGAPAGGDIRFTGFTAPLLLVRLLALLRANAAAQAMTVTVYLYSDPAWTTPVLISPAFDQAAMPVWGPSVGDSYQLLDADVPVQSIAFRFVAPSPGSYDLSLGRLWASPALVLPGVGRDWKLAHVANSVVRVTPHRVVSQTRLPSHNRLVAPITRLTEAQAYGINNTNSVCLDRIAHEAGAGDQVVVLPRTSSTLYMRRFGVYGVLENDVDIDHDRGPYYKSSLTIGQTQ